jgi:ADP-heptose:LPS heptosyltransferase
MIPTEELLQKASEFHRLKEQGALTADAASATASRAAELIVELHIKGCDTDVPGSCLREAIQLICEVATDDDPQIAQAGIIALFPSLVERLNDSFDPAACRLYDRLFAQVIEFCRRLQEGQRLDEGLNQFGLRNEADLLARKAQITNHKSQIPNPTSFGFVKKVLLLSRVTIGADVAVTSTIISKLHAALPQAEFVILGSRKLRELYGGGARIRIREVAYERGGALISRLTSWLDVVNAVNEERREFGKDEVWMIDPDSRLAQLGLLPLVEHDYNYFFFESRSYQGDGESKSIGQLAALWAGELIGNVEPAFPFVALPAEYKSFGQEIIGQLRRSKSIRNRILTISFGVGGNHSKRVSDEFEERLVHHLLTDAKLILDKGASAEERDQINRFVTGLRAEGRYVVEINDGNKPQLDNLDLRSADVVTWDGGIGAFAGLIAASDGYLGYDSAGQHIAAALGVPTLAVFVNPDNATFAERWRPFGGGKIEVVNIEAAELAGSINPAAVLSRMVLRRQV